MKKIVLGALMTMLMMGCASTEKAPEGYDFLAPARDEDKIAAAAAAVAPKGKAQSCGVKFDLERAGWFVAKGWAAPFNKVASYKLFISRHQGGPYCPVDKVITQDQLVIRGLEEDRVYYLVLQSVMTDGSKSKPSQEWAVSAVRRDYHLPRSVEKYPAQ